MPQALIRVARGEANRYFVAAVRSLAVSAPHRHAPLREPKFDEFLPTEQDPRRRSGTCLILLALNIGAGALFAPRNRPSPDLILPSKRRARVRKPARRRSRSSRSKPFSRRHQSKRDRRPPNSAPLATPSTGGPIGVGSNLWNIVGSDRGEGRGGFNFSAAMKAKGGKWTFDELNKFLANPRQYIPGTAMTFAEFQSPNSAPM